MLHQGKEYREERDKKLHLCRRDKNSWKGFTLRYKPIKTMIFLKKFIEHPVLHHPSSLQNAFTITVEISKRCRLSLKNRTKVNPKAMEGDEIRTF